MNIKHLKKREYKRDTFFCTIGTLYYYVPMYGFNPVNLGKTSRCRYGENYFEM